MKKITGLFLVCLFTVCVTASAQDYKTALGVRLSSGAPVVNNSISLKYFIKPGTAVEALFSFGDPLAFGGLLEFHKPFAGTGLNYFYGAGAYLGFSKTFDVNKQRDVRNTSFGTQGVVGLDYKFANAPLNISLDWKPELNIISDINFEPAAVGLTARFTFNGAKKN